jgi:hypothetical protein
MRIAPLVLALALAVVPAMGDLLAYDSFTGDPGILYGHVGELNLNAWDNQSGNTYSLSAPGLEFGALQVAGGKAEGAGLWQNAGARLIVPASWEAPNELTPWTKEGPADGRFRLGKEGTVLWASYLVEDWNANDGNRLRFADSDIGWNPGSHGVGIEVKNGNWQMQDVAAGTYVDTGVARTLNETYLMVLKFEFMIGGEGQDATWEEGCDRVTMFVNPTPGAAAPDVAGTVMSTTTDLALLNVHFYPGSGSNEGAIDEIRLGATYADVTPVPEPATMALVALGGLMPLLRRRRG